MANEATVLVEGTAKSIVREFTVADGTAIPKGTLMVYDTATRTAVAHGVSAVNKTERPLGFATTEKEANDGKTTIGLQRTGVVDAWNDGGVATGDLVGLGTTANRVRGLYGAVSIYQEIWFGRALETGATATQVKIALALG